MSVENSTMFRSFELLGVREELSEMDDGSVITESPESVDREVFKEVGISRIRRSLLRLNAAVIYTKSYRINSKQPTVFLREKSGTTTHLCAIEGPNEDHFGIC